MSESLRAMLFSCSGDGAGVTRVTSCLCSFSLPERVGGGGGAGGSKMSGVGGETWVRKEGNKQELLTDNELSHQGNVLVVFFYFLHKLADVVEK